MQWQACWVCWGVDSIWVCTTVQPQPLCVGVTLTFTLSRNHSQGWKFLQLLLMHSLSWTCIPSGETEGSAVGEYDYSNGRERARWGQWGVGEMRNTENKQAVPWSEKLFLNEPQSHPELCQYTPAMYTLRLLSYYIMSKMTFLNV